MCFFNSTHDSQENIHESTENTLNKNINTESVESKTKLFIKDTQVSPNRIGYVKTNCETLRIQRNLTNKTVFRNEYSKNVTCDLKFSEFNDHIGSNITIDAEEIPFDQIEFSNV